MIFEFKVDKWGMPIQESGSIQEMATSGSTIKKYQSLLDKPVWDKQEVLGVAHQLSGLHRGRNRDSMDEEFKYILHDLLSYFDDEGKTKDISSDQTQKGIDWLTKSVLNAQGELRNTKLVRDAGFDEDEANIIKDFKKFELSGFVNVGRESHPVYAPKYKVISKSGDSFEYFVSGGWGGASIRVVVDAGLGVLG